MGSAASAPQRAWPDWKADDLAAAVEGLGGGLAATAAIIRQNGGNVDSALAKLRAQQASEARDDSKVRERNLLRAARGARPWSSSASDLEAWLADVAASSDEASRGEVERLAKALRGASGVDLLATCAVETERPPFCKLRRDATGQSLLRTRLFKITTIRVVEEALLDAGLAYFFALWHAADSPSMLFDLVWETRLGSGSFGEVHCARNLHTNELRAVKLVKVCLDDDTDDRQSEASSDDEDARVGAVEQMSAESATTRRRPERTSSTRRLETSCAAIERCTAEMAAQQRAAAASEFVVDIDAWGSFGGRGSPVYVYSIMELCARPLADDIVQGTGIPDERRRSCLYVQLALALRDLHGARLIHSDLTPANVLLSTTGDVRLADLGLAAAVETDRVVARSRVGGTRDYMAPEVPSGAYSNKVDVYSLGLIFYEMATGTLPDLEADDVVRPLHGRIDPRIVDLIAAMVDAAPSARPTAAQLVDSLVAVASPPASPFSPQPRSLRPSPAKRRRQQRALQRANRRCDAGGAVEGVACSRTM